LFIKSVQHRTDCRHSTVHVMLTAAKAKWRERKKLSKRIKGVDLSVLTCMTDSNIRQENSMDNWCSEKGGTFAFFFGMQDDSMGMSV
jgi:hypothetical protein